MILAKLECLIGSIVTAALCIALTIVYFEGISVPSFVPLIGGVQIIDGAIAHRLEGYVALSEKTAADAKATEQKRQADAAKASADKANQDAATAKANAAALQISREKDIASYEQKLVEAKRACLLDNDDSTFILQHH